MTVGEKGGMKADWKVDEMVVLMVAELVDVMVVGKAG